MVQVAELSLAQRVGQVLSVGWGRHGALGVGAVQSDEDPDQVATLITELGLGGICYFPGKAEGDTADEVRPVVERLQRLAIETSGVPLNVSVDQEGGRVARLRRGFTAVPAARELGSDPDRVRELAEQSGRELKQAGMTMVYAPVADVDSNPDNPVIADRSYSADPDQVARCVVAAIEGYHAAGIACVAKHFPGHGDTNVDSHLALPVVHRTLEDWRALEAVPFRAAVEAGVDAIMVGHLVFADLDSTMTTVSARAIALLREELGFGGLVVTDALEMRGATTGREPGTLVVDSLAAGVDQLLMPTDIRQAHAALLDAVTSGRVPQQRLDEACGRVLEQKRRRG